MMSISSSVTSSIFYLLVMSLVGIPIWLKTTSPSRYSLPDVSSLVASSQRKEHKVTITVVAVDTLFDDEKRRLLRHRLSSEWPNRLFGDGSVDFQYHWTVRQPLAEEASIFERAMSLDQVDRLLNKKESHLKKGNLWVFLVNEDMLKGRQRLLGSSRFVYINSRLEERAGEDREGNSLSESVVETVQQMLEPHKSPSDEKSSLIVDNSDSVKLLINPEMDIFVNIITEVIEDAIELQNSQKLKDLHLLLNSAFVSRSGISELLDIKVTTQMVYHSLSSDFISSHLLTNDSTERLFRSNDVPLMLNAIESRLIEPNNKQSYNLNVFVPAKDAAPLFVFEATSGAKSNAIITPYRGGLLIWNQKDDFNLGFKAFMRSIIGLSHVHHQDSLRTDMFFSKWELDAVIRSVAGLQLQKTLSSLESIEKLIQKVNNMVIIEEIANRMHLSVDYSHKSINFLSVGLLGEAYALSSKAYVASETAFFDPSLLSLLYFPEDQKYAVYFPLFLPVSLPLMSSLLNLFKAFKARYKKSP